MARKPDSVKSSAIAVYADEHQLRRVRTFTSDTSFKDENILELSNVGVAETIDDMDTVSITVDCHEFGSSENMAKFVNFFQAADTGANANKHSVTDSSFDNAQVDFIVKLTSGTATDALAASCWMGGQWLTGWTASFSADGNASESYTFEGEYKRWFMNAYRDVYVASGTYTTSTTATIGQNLSTTAGYTPRIVTVNGLIKADMKAGGTNAITLTNASSSILSATDSDNAAVNFQAGDRIRVVVAKNTPAAFGSLTSTPAGIGALRKGMIDIFIYDATGTEEKTLRLQSVNFNVGLDRTANSELGNKRIYQRVLNRPISVEISCEANLSDLEIYAKLSDKETEWDNMSLNEIDTDDFVATSKLIVKVYKSETTHSAANLLKTITVTGLTVSKDGFNADAGGIGKVSFTLKGTSCQIAGNSVSPIL